MQTDTAPERETPPPDTPPDVLNEAAVDPSPEVPTAKAEVPRPPPRPERRGGFVAPLLGGALAAGLGFGLSHFNALGIRPNSDIATPAVLEQQAAEIAGLKSSLAETEAALADRIARVEPLLQAPAPEAMDLAPITQRLDSLETRLAQIEAMPASGAAYAPAIQAAVRDLEAKVAALGTVATVPDELSQKVDAALARLADAEAAAEAKAAEAAGATEAARRSVALDALAAAIDRGEPFDTLLAGLALDPAPAPLVQHAATGVPTLAALTESFPEAARAALLKTRDVSGSDGWGARLADFLKAQTGARPLTPQAGTDPEAILSRAEAALRDGRIADALTEIAGLPADVAAVMAEWSAGAKARAEVDAAMAALRASAETQGE
ncbi:COG4223 family protein [Tabrizicola sp. BL-A-41-H6]|uniref:COG4223 family protein n=1 Tax=Tabrizicola sp. BL-A-41-H6 TaxID=3421107 RepID=UPI003D66AD4F